MIVEYIRYAIPEDQAGPFEDAYANAGAPLEASPHCEHYEVARCAEDPTAYAVRIEWDSAVGHQRGSAEARSSATSSPRCGPAWT
jgi:hemoglobin